MAKKRKKPDPYSEEVIREKRTFPVGKTIGVVLLLLLQIVLITFAILYHPEPQDRIDSYELFAIPQEDGAVELEYRFVWTALDPNEDLTWVEIGMANASFEFLPDATSPNIVSAQRYINEDYVSARLTLDRPYHAGETITFSFRVRQRELLCRAPDGYFYEFVPGWFNRTPVTHYRFTWAGEPVPRYANTELLTEGNPLWEGSMPCGSYVKLQVHYDEDAFTGVHTVGYEAFDAEGVTDDLKEEKSGVVIFAVFSSIVLLIAQVYMIDSVVSYHRGRGFLTGYGYHIHVYGRTNPAYKRGKSGGGHSGGGCACACACACAGGGRAGCSQKDTHPYPLRHTAERTEESRTSANGKE